MAVEGKTWVKEAEKLGEKEWFCLAKTIDSLGLSESEVKRDILVVGPGRYFPERLLLCNSESRYASLRKEVETLTLCDKNAKVFNSFSTIDYWVDHRPVMVIPFSNNNFQRSSYRFFYSNVESFLASNQDQFDAIMSFCFPNIEKFENGLDSQIVRHLKFGGCLMGSGLCPKDAEFYLPGLKIEKLVEMDQLKTGEKYLGFLARKPA